jgi:hypothetical protein
MFSPFDLYISMDNLCISFDRFHICCISRVWVVVLICFVWCFLYDMLFFSFISLNSLVIFLVSFPLYVKVAHFVFGFVCLYVGFVFVHSVWCLYYIRYCVICEEAKDIEMNKIKYILLLQAHYHQQHHRNFPLTLAKISDLNPCISWYEYVVLSKVLYKNGLLS